LASLERTANRIAKSHGAGKRTVSKVFGVGGCAQDGEFGRLKVQH
jgi:hypothetical protein